MCAVTWQLSDPSSGLVAGWSSARTIALITRQRVCFSVGHSRTVGACQVSWDLGSELAGKKPVAGGHCCFLFVAFVYVVFWWGTVYQALPFSFHAAELLTVIQIGTSLGGRPWAGISKLWCHGTCRERLAGSRRWADVIEQAQSDSEKQRWHFSCVDCHTSLSTLHLDNCQCPPCGLCPGSSAIPGYLPWCPRSFTEERRAEGEARSDGLFFLLDQSIPHGLNFCPPTNASSDPTSVFRSFLVVEPWGISSLQLFCHTHTPTGHFTRLVPFHTYNLDLSL